MGEESGSGGSRSARLPKRLIRVVVIDDHRSFVDALRLLFEASGAIELVGGVTDPARAADIVEDCQPDVALLDMRFPSDDGLKALLHIRELEYQPRVVILSSSTEAEDVRGALLAGAVGYVTKDGSGQGIIEAVRAAANGLIVMSSSALTTLRIQPSAIQLRLSARQLSLLECVSRGATDDEIAAEMNVSRATLQRELQQCIRDLGARNRTHAAVIAAQSGWI